MSKPTDELAIVNSMGSNDTIVIVIGGKTQRITAQQFLDTFGIGAAEVLNRISREVSSTGDVVLGDSVLLCDCSGGGFNLTLPAVASAQGITYSIKKIDTGSNSVNILTTGAETIDGDVSLTIGGTPNLTIVDVYSDGTNWWRLDG